MKNFYTTKIIFAFTLLLTACTSFVATQSQNQNTIHFINGSSQKITIFFPGQSQGHLINSHGSLHYNPSTTVTNYTVSAAECSNTNSNALQGHDYIICIYNGTVTTFDGTNQAVTGSICPTIQPSTPAPSPAAFGAQSQAQSPAAATSATSKRR